jgi:hypothetical protein
MPRTAVELNDLRETLEKHSAGIWEFPCRIAINEREGLKFSVKVAGATDKVLVNDVQIAISPTFAEADIPSLVTSFTNEMLKFAV